MSWRCLDKQLLDAFPVLAKFVPWGHACDIAGRTERIDLTEIKP